MVHFNRSRRVIRVGVHACAGCRWVRGAWRRDGARIAGIVGGERGAGVWEGGAVGVCGGGVGGAVAGCMRR
jgi:hypothetical protein